MRVLDLFSGIGGFSLGLERAGMETVAFCEWDEAARKVLTKHWPDIKQYHDVKDLTAERLQDDGITDIELICGGYPCQPFSTAGKRLGEEDDRHLWPEVRRLIQEIRPNWVLCENVAGHVSMGLDCVLADLEDAGYQCQTLLIPACAVGAHHRRDRVWILAHTDSPQRKGGRLSSGVQAEQPNIKRGSGNGGSSEVLADALCSRRPRQRESVKPFHSKATDQRKAVKFINGGQSDQRIIESYVGREADGFPGWMDGSWDSIPRVSSGRDSARLKQLGNSVVPQVVEVIGKAIMEASECPS